MTMFERTTAQHWYERWETQQQLYAGDRDERFETVLDVVEGTCPQPRVIVDLGCGPGSLAVRAARRFKGSEVVAVDSDPFLLALGASAHPNVEFTRADVGAEGWTDVVAQHSGRIDAVISSSALHYPDLDTLAMIYDDCFALLGSRSALINADQFYPDDPRWIATLNAVECIRASRRTTRPGEDWAQWWRAAHAEPLFSDALARRATEVPLHHRDNGLSIDKHIALMKRAGFDVAGPVWQHGHSAVLAATTGAPKSAGRSQVRT